jgi:hypothetical protein
VIKMRTFFVYAFCGLAATLHAQHPPAIASISICSTSGVGGQGSCPSGKFDTQQIVLGPGGGSINQTAEGTSDEHSSVFSPGTLGDNPDYLFFVAAGTSLNQEDGALVLSGGSGPINGQWTFNFPDGYDTFPAGFGHIFVQPLGGESCPKIADGKPAEQDPTFDLRYAAPGSIVKLPAGRPGSVLMVYEGVNPCIGNAGGPKDTFGGQYISVGIATSFDYGKTWQTYRGTPSFDFVQLPDNNKISGPNAPYGAMGKDVCMGNDCTTTPPEIYGRYQILSPSPSLVSLMEKGDKLPSVLGPQEPSAFVDDVRQGDAQYLYVLVGDVIARAHFNGEAPLTFQKWDGTAFESPGLGGADSPIFPQGKFESCQAADQLIFGASISYVEDTQQYLLTFVCNTPGDEDGPPQGTATRGAAWFFSTSHDLSDQTQWTTPKQIEGSWKQFEFSTDPTDPTDNGCTLYNGWYPTFMSMGAQPAHLSLTGYVFEMSGCQTGGAKREFSSRAFTITTTPKP